MFRDMWARHRRDCATCRGREYLEDLCREGREIAGLAMEEGAGERERERESSMVAVPAELAAGTAGARGQMALARSESGAAVLVPLEKTAGGDVIVRTSRDVVLNLPARDIEIYSSMRALTARLLRAAEALAALSGAGRDQDRPEDGSRAYDELAALEGPLMALADEVGKFMTVDAETRRVIRAARMLAIHVRGELERDARTRRVRADGANLKLARQMRTLAVDLEGEKERRLGT